MAEAKPKDKEGKRTVATPGHELRRADGEIPIQVMESDELHVELVKLKNEISENYFRLAAALKKAFDTRAYADWGYKLWKDFVEAEMDMGERKAQYLMKIHHWFVTVLKDDTVRKRVEHLGWTKVKFLVGVVDEDNVDFWVERAENMTAVQLEEFIKQLRSGNTDGAGEAEQLATMTFRLYPGQQDNVQEALEMAADIAEKSDEIESKKGHLLDLICSTFRVDHVFQRQPGDRALKHYFQKMANMVDVNVIVTERGTGKILTGEKHLVKAAKQAKPKMQDKIAEALVEASD